MIRLFLLFLLLATPAAAQAVRVSSGEHEGFTRVVLQYGQPVDWQVGRTADGYELRLTGNAPRYDLSRAFDIIGRDRLSGLWVDPDTGGLRIGVACACHALPFALRPDTVVIDLRDGPAPTGWSFEAALDGTDLPSLGTKAPGPVGPVPWNWRDMALGGRWSGSEPSVVPQPLLPETPSPRNIVLETALAEGFARAATQGLVDPVGKPPPVKEPAAEAPEMAQISLGIQARPASQQAVALSAQGVQCPGETRLALQDWGDDRPIREQMADATTSLAGEFDRTESEALFRAIRFQLFLGFGAEARALMRAFDGPKPDAPLWTTLSLIVDGGTDPDGALRGLAGCDDPAALWATLADPALSLAEVNTTALLRTFSALPPHLRLQVGPGLAERFMSAGDTTTAQGLSDAILRPLASDDDRRATLMQVRLALEAGDAATADRFLTQLLQDPGPLSAQATVAQIDLAALTGAPVAQATVTSVQAILREADATQAPVLARALVLSLALSGDFDAAFRALPDSPETLGALWRILAEKGPDDALVTQSLSLDVSTQSALSAETRRVLADRLLTLGFPDAARFWVGGDDPLLSARAALASGQPAEVLRLLGPPDGEEARTLKARALVKLDAAAAVPAFAALGDAASAERAARLAEAWPELAANGQEPWRRVAESLAAPATPETALARSRALADSSTRTGAAIDALLATVPAPDAP